MKADKTLDAKIAGEVMKWRVNRVMTGKFTEDAYYCELFSTIKIMSVKDWSPSTQMADAWLVVEKMNNDGYCVEIFHDMVAWSVCFMHIDTAEKHCADWKNSIEVQICLAALKTVA